MTADPVQQWKQLLAELASGRLLTEMRCPFCAEGALDLAVTDDRIRIACDSCRHFVEARIGVLADDA